MIKKVITFSNKLKKDHVSAYAAQSAFFLLLSMIPIILLLLTFVQYTPLTRADVMKVAYELLPTTIRTTMVLIINEVYKQKVRMIPVTALLAMWSAGRGTLAIANGLNCVYGQEENRNFIYLRIRAAIYTVLWVFAIVLCLVILGFGNRIGVVSTICLMIVFSTMVYRFLPNNRRRWRKQLFGAVFTVSGWILASFIFSIYMDVFRGFSNMYGSLTTIVIIMLWLYFCMYVLLVGGEINVLLEQEKEE